MGCWEPANWANRSSKTGARKAGSWPNMAWEQADWGKGIRKTGPRGAGGLGCGTKQTESGGSRQTRTSRVGRLDQCESRGTGARGNRDQTKGGRTGSVSMSMKMNMNENEYEYE
jgi:hypothetical protein